MARTEYMTKEEIEAVFDRMAEARGITRAELDEEINTLRDIAADPSHLTFRDFGSPQNLTEEQQLHLESCDYCIHLSRILG